MAYSDGLRSQLIRAVEKGRSARSQAEVFFIAPSTAVKWTAAFRSKGRPGPKPLGGGRRSPLGVNADWLKARVTEKPKITLAKLHGELVVRGVSTSQSAVSRIFERNGYSFKKACRRTNRIAPKWWLRARHGGSSSRCSIRKGS